MSKENYLKKELYKLVQTDPAIFEFLQSGSLDGIWYWDLEKPENEWMSKRFWEAFGYKHSEKKHLSKEWQDMIFPDDLKLAIDNFTQHCKNKKHPYDQVVRYKHKNGSTVWVRCRGLAIRDKKGKPIRMLGAHTNLTSLKQTEEQLRKFKKAVDSATDGIVMTNLNHEIIYTNSSFENLFGKSEAQLIGNNINQYVSPETPENILKVLEQTVNQGKVFSTEEMVLKTNKSSIPVHMSIFPVIDDGAVQFFVGIIQDISERKAIEKAKTEFVSLASHQLRTPLSIINWYTERLLSADFDNLMKIQKDYLGEIKNAKNRMNTLIDALLNVSRLEMGTFCISPKRTNFVSIAKKIINELKPEIEAKKLKVSTRFPKLPNLMLDENLVTIILENLMTNAIKYNKKGGQIIVSLKKKGEEVIISVSDTGIGIPKNQQNKIFTKLFRAENAQMIKADGTGLGLYITKMILDEIGGRIWFESKRNKGTTFHTCFLLKNMKANNGTKALT